MENSIQLEHIWQIENPGRYKLHFARWNGKKQPLQDWAEDHDNWFGWQQYWPGRNDFNRQFIFSLMDYYHETDTWLFGGVFEVTGLSDWRDSKRYEVELTDQGASLIGRLKLRSSYRDRTTRVNFENHYSKLEVGEILSEPYTGQVFPGFEKINHSFTELAHIWTIQKSDWKIALRNLKGVYLITDISNGKNYVGSAYGDGRIWSRWGDYLLGGGHGGNAGLKSLLAAKGGVVYAQANFRFSLMEVWAREVPDETIIGRESYWKDVLRSREHGYNEN